MTDGFKVETNGTTKYYKTLSEAVGAAGATATITVVGDPAVNEAVTIPNGKNITLKGEQGAALRLAQ